MHGARLHFRSFGISSEPNGSYETVETIWSRKVLLVIAAYLVSTKKIKTYCPCTCDGTIEKVTKSFGEVLEFLTALWLRRQGLGEAMGLYQNPDFSALFILILHSVIGPDLKNKVSPRGSNDPRFAQLTLSWRSPRMSAQAAETKPARHLGQQRFHSNNHRETHENGRYPIGSPDYRILGPGDGD